MTETKTESQQEQAAEPALAGKPAAGATTAPGATVAPLVATVLSLQRSAGNRATRAALARRPARGDRGRRLARAVWADLFDYDQLATQIQQGGAGSGTDEVKIFQALERLQRDPAAIQRLEAAYRRRFGVTLEAELRDELGDGDLNFALQLINRGGGGTAQQIWGPPNGPAYHAAAAQRIRTAVEGAGTDEAAIYAVLVPYWRRADLVQDLARVYAQRYGEDLRSRLNSELESDEFANARYLMGEYVLEQSELSVTQVDALYEMMAGLRFQNTRGEWVPVPFHYPRDGCYARAHMMSQVMTAAGFANERMFATSTVLGQPLRVESPYSSEDIGVPPGPGPATTAWFYHVAPVVRVRNNGRSEQWVIDPSTQPRAVPYQVWLQNMGMITDASGRPANYSRMTHEELQRHLASTSADRTPGRVGSFRGGERLAWTTARNTISPEDMPSRDLGRGDRGLESLRARMTNYADQVPINELAAEIRGILGRPGATPSQIVAAIRRRPPPVRQALWIMFPYLYGECARRFPAAATELGNAATP